VQRPEAFMMAEAKRSNPKRREQMAKERKNHKEKTTTNCKEIDQTLLICPKKTM